jgi:Ras-related protein Rab-11A
MLVGNKCDLEHLREVSVEEGQSLAQSESLFFIETSALDSTNVVNAFQMVIKEIHSIVSRKILASNLTKDSSTFNNTRVVALQEDCEEEVVHVKSRCCSN